MVLGRRACAAGSAKRGAGMVRDVGFPKLTWPEVAAEEGPDDEDDRHGGCQVLGVEVLRARRAGGQGPSTSIRSCCTRMMHAAPKEEHIKRHKRPCSACNPAVSGLRHIGGTRQQSAAQKNSELRISLHGSGMCLVCCAHIR